MASLELGRSGVAASLRRTGLPDATVAGAASFVGGGLASLSSHAITVPMDVVAQRQMIRTGQAAGGAAPTVGRGGLAMVQHILATEGPRGMYRGLGASIATYVPSSAIWWSAYGVWQSLLWGEVDRWHGRDSLAEPSEGLIALVQVRVLLLRWCKGRGPARLLGNGGGGPGNACSTGRATPGARPDTRDDPTCRPARGWRRARRRRC